MLCRILCSGRVLIGNWWEEQKAKETSVRSPFTGITTSQATYTPEVCASFLCSRICLVTGIKMPDYKINPFRSSPYKGTSSCSDDMPDETFY